MERSHTSSAAGAGATRQPLTAPASNPRRAGQPAPIRPSSPRAELTEDTQSAGRPPHVRSWCGIAGDTGRLGPRSGTQLGQARPRPWQVRPLPAGGFAKSTPAPAAPVSPRIGVPPSRFWYGYHSHVPGPCRNRSVHSPCSRGVTGRRTFGGAEVSEASPKGCGTASHVSGSLPRVQVQVLPRALTRTRPMSYRSSILSGMATDDLQASRERLIAVLRSELHRHTITALGMANYDPGRPRYRAMAEAFVAEFQERVGRNSAALLAFNGTKRRKPW